MNESDFLTGHFGDKLGSVTVSTTHLFLLHMGSIVLFTIRKVDGA